MPNWIAEATFTIAGVITVLLLLVRVNNLGPRERSAAAAAAFGLFLCGRHAEFLVDMHDWIFTIAVAVLMIQLAYGSLGFSKPLRTTS